LNDDDDDGVKFNGPALRISFVVKEKNMKSNKTSNKWLLLLFLALSLARDEDYLITLIVFQLQ
jgi:hypothetical protein